MEGFGLSLWPGRKWPKEPDDTMQLAIGGQLTEVDSLDIHRPIRKQHAPGETKVLVVCINSAGRLKVGSRELLKAPPDMIDELLSACDACERVGVRPVLSPCPIE